MADVRSLLRSEQASRRISHPHLSYTRSGQLHCTVCDLLIKSASLWEGHLRSPNHRKNSHLIAERAEDSGNTKKRKNDDSDEESRKRSRAASEEVEAPAESVQGAGALNRPKKKVKSVTFAESTIQQPAASLNEHQLGQAPDDTPNQEHAAEEGLALQQAIDEEEWAAFERDVAPLAQEPPQDSQYSATIVAAPVSAAEVAAQQESTRRPTKEIEAEEEKEDEERRLEEELDVMEEMEERVRKLREKREALRKGTHDSVTGTVAGRPITTDVGANNDVLDLDVNGGSDDSDDDDEDYDDWGFR